MVIKEDNLNRYSITIEDGQLLVGHLEATIPNEEDNLLVRIGQLGTNRRWNPNIQTVHAQVSPGNTKRMNVCTSCLKAGKVARG